MAEKQTPPSTPEPKQHQKSEKPKYLNDKRAKPNNMRCSH